MPGSLCTRLLSVNSRAKSHPAVSSIFQNQADLQPAAPSFTSYTPPEIAEPSEQCSLQTQYTSMNHFMDYESTQNTE